ncbi:PLP-dependent transferase [Thozetella sp. PMI_491]|nr:PLP-dependent transferase [Thozetella sp. PMI_491]
MDALDRTMAGATCKVKALLLVNPNNPLGQCYPREVLEECVKFCEKHDIHFISDEIYALTSYRAHDLPAPNPFISAISLDLAALGCDPKRVHMIWSTSKDLGQNGLRMGCLVSQANEGVRTGAALWSTATVSSFTAAAVAHVLRSPRLKDILKTSSERLSSAYTSMTDMLRRNGIDYVPANAGLFVFARLAPDATTWEDESEVVQQLKEAGVIVSGGRGYHTADLAKGWARVASGIMSNLLSDLIVSLQRSLEGLKHGKEGRDIYRSLHDPQELPDKQLYAQASQAVDLLYEIQQLLEPSTLILADHFLGYVKAKCLCTAVELDVPGLLQGGPKDIDQIAAASGARPDRLGRVLRLLVTHGIFAFDGNTGCFSNNRSSTLLLKDHWTQWHNWVDLYGNQFYDIARGIPASCKAGSTRNAAQHEFGTDKDMFTYFSERGWVSQFHKTLSGGATAMAPGILADYPWEELEGLTFLDVGGGSGGLVALVLRGHPSMRAGILDLPQVIAQASTNFHTPDVIILESILADGRIGHLTGYADINVMTAAHSGQERDEHQWRALARNTGWELRKIYPLRNSWPPSADQTNYINYLKPLILAEELGFAHVLSIIDTRDEWYRSIHPERYVPALQDQDPETGEKVVVFEGTACLQYLAERFDTEGYWTGKTAFEKANVLSWTAYQTAGLGLHANVLQQWDVMERRLSEPGQHFIALKDRPTLADLSYFPFAMPWMFKFLGVNVQDWPAIEKWGERMLARPAVKTILERGPTYGH